MLNFDWSNFLNEKTMAASETDMVPPLNAERGDINENPGAFKKKKPERPMWVFLGIFLSR